jgi:polar amino acid transport system permease protein
MTDGVLIPRKDDNHVLNAWRITFFAALALLAGWSSSSLPPTATSPRDHQGAPVTFEVTIFAIMGAIVIGLFCGLGSVRRPFHQHDQRCLRRVDPRHPVAGPLIFIYYAMGRFFHIEGMVAAIIALSICFGAYMARSSEPAFRRYRKDRWRRPSLLAQSRTGFQTCHPATDRQGDPSGRRK